MDARFPVPYGPRAMKKRLVLLLVTPLMLGLVGAFISLETVDVPRFLDHLTGTMEMVDGQPRQVGGVVRFDEAWLKDLAAQTHQGPPPCLRYLGFDNTDDGRVQRLVAELEQRGLLQKFVDGGFFNGLFYTWRAKREAQLHRADEPEEFLDAVQQRAGWLDGLVIRRHRDALLRVARETHAQSVNLLEERAATEEDMLTAEEAISLAVVWALYPLETMPTGLVKTMQYARPRYTVIRMDRLARVLAQWMRNTGTVPDSLQALVADGSLQGAELRDAWLMDIVLEVQGEHVRLVSLGRDRERGGTGEDEDIITELMPAGAHPADTGQDGRMEP